MKSAIVVPQLERREIFTWADYQSRRADAGHACDIVSHVALGKNKTATDLHKITYSRQVTFFIEILLFFGLTWQPGMNPKLAAAC